METGILCSHRTYKELDCNENGGFTLSRPKKNPNYDYQRIAKEIMESVVEAYQSPSSYVASKDGTIPLNIVAEEFSMARLRQKQAAIAKRNGPPVQEQEVNWNRK